MSSRWKALYELNSARAPSAGSSHELASAIRRGADLRIYSEFRHNEHIDPSSSCRELIQEVSEFGVTYLIDDRWSAGIMSLRQPVAIPDGFGPRPSMSFFLYNEDGRQAIARPYLDGAEPQFEPAFDMPKYHLENRFDENSNAPSHNFVYDFEVFRFCVADDWEEVFAHSSAGEPIHGSLHRLAEEFARGRAIKAGIRDLYTGSEGPSHEVFVQTGPGYYYTDRNLFLAETHPVVCVKPAIPLRYESGAWDFGWLLPRTDGTVFRWMVNPYTLRFQRSESRHAIRWFVR